MRHIVLLSGVTLAMLSPLASIAAESANLRVTGTITPSSCSVTLGGTSEVSLGTIKLGDFVEGQDLVRPRKTASLSVDCQGAATKFRLKSSDAKGNFPGATAEQYSLGYIEQGGGAAKPVGYFRLGIDTESMATHKYVLKSTDQGVGQAWAAPVTGDVAFDHGGEAFAFAADNAATEPAALASLTVPLTIDAVLFKDPSVIDDVALDGQATIEIFY